jgi:HlyD family secretion protein
MVLAVLLGGALVVALRPSPLLLEVGPVGRGAVEAYVAEEGRLRLAQEYVVSMPVPGDLQRIALEVGDAVTAGDVVARLDDFALQRELAGLEALLAQGAAQVEGVGVQKPKPEDLASSAERVRAAAHAAAVARREVEIAGVRLEQAARAQARAEALAAQGIASPAEAEDAAAARRAAAAQQAAAAQALQARESEETLARLAAQRLAGSMDDNEYQRRVHEAEMARVRAERAVVLDRIEKTLLRAPADGVVLEKYETSARPLPAGAPLLRLGDPAGLEIECDVLSDEVVAVRPGNPVEILGGGVPVERARGTVRQVYPAAFTKRSSLGIEQQRVRVIVDFDHAGLGLRPGTRVDLRIVTARRADVLTVPDRAVFREGGEHHVFRVRDGRAERVAVRLGIRNEHTAEVVSGLGEGDTVVYEPTTTLHAGARVAPSD